MFIGRTHTRHRLLGIMSKIDVQMMDQVPHAADITWDGFISIGLDDLRISGG